MLAKVALTNQYHDTYIWHHRLKQKFKLERTEWAETWSLPPRRGTGFWKHRFAVVHWNQQGWPQRYCIEITRGASPSGTVWSPLKTFTHSSSNEKRGNKLTNTSPLHTPELNGDPNYQPQSMTQAESCRNTRAYLLMCWTHTAPCINTDLGWCNVE